MTDRLANWLAQPTSLAEYTAVGLLLVACLCLLWGQLARRDDRL